MCHCIEMYWETYLSDQTNTQTLIFKNFLLRCVYEQNRIDVT